MHLTGIWAHQFVASANNSLSDHIITDSSCYELFKYTGSLTVKFNADHSAVISMTIMTCAAGNELEIEILRVSCDSICCSM